MREKRISMTRGVICVGLAGARFIVGAKIVSKVDWALL
jgi:hypothetical protein